MVDLIKEICRSLWPEKRSHRIIFVTVGVLFLWFFSGIFNFSFHSNERQEKEILKVRVKTVKAEEKIPYTKVSGVTEEQRVVEIRAETDGQVIELIHKKGDQVKQGDVLVKLSLDTRRAKLAEAKALLEQRKLEYEVSKKLKKQKFRSKTMVAEAKAKYEAAQSQLDEIQNSIKDTKIVAPFDGVMDKNYVEVGSYVKVGDNVVEMIDLNPLVIATFVSEKDLCCVKMGRVVEVIFANGETREGTIVYSSVAADPNTRTFRVEVEVENKDNTLRSGLTADVVIPREPVKAHLISAGLLTMNDEGILGVHSVNGGNIVEFHKVTIIAHDNGSVWIAGLPEETNLITVGQDFVTKDQEVIPVPEEGVLTDAKTR